MSPIKSETRHFKDVSDNHIKTSLRQFLYSFDFLIVVLGRSSIIIDNQSFTSLILINRLQNWQSILIGKGDT